MRNFKILFILISGLALFSASSCKKNDSVQKESDLIKMDSTKTTAFFAKYPDFKPFQKQIGELYEKRDNNYVWYDKDGRIDFAEVLYNKVNQIGADGIITPFPYKKQIDAVFAQSENKKENTENELLISSMYFYYTKKVYEGVDTKKSKSLGWFLPRENVSYVSYLDTLMKDPDLIKKDESELIGQYYNLKKGLQIYRNIQKNGGWGTITLAEGTKSIKPNESNAAVAQLRKRLVFSGDLKNDSGSMVFDKELQEALANYEKRHNMVPDNLITPSIVKHLNVTVEERIKTIIVNMERCRWITPDITDSKELIAVNIPSYTLNYYRDGKPVLTSNVVVGKDVNKTVVFSGQMSYLVFSPYWNIPPSIIKKEIKPAMDKDPDYLAKHNMEWNNGQVRQKPGPENSLGLVKFMFPNSNNIYLHDSPAKALFNKESRAFSHGCIRVQKARELAIKILDSDKNWSADKIDAAMKSGTEKNYSLKRKIPVYIAYFTARADANGNLSFFEDIYNRDNRLAHLLYNDALK